MATSGCRWLCTAISLVASVHCSRTIRFQYLYEYLWYPTCGPGLSCSLQVIQLTRDLLQESLQAEAAVQGAGEVQEPAPKKQRREICLGPPLDA